MGRKDRKNRNLMEMIKGNETAIAKIISSFVSDAIEQVEIEVQDTKYYVRVTFRSLKNMNLEYPKKETEKPGDT